MDGSGGDASSTDGADEAIRLSARGWLGRRQGPVWGMARRSIDWAQDRVSGSAFARSVSVLLVSTVVGQAAGVLLAPFLTRIFSPEEFGMLSVYSSTLGVFGSAACLRYEIAIPSARDDVEASNLIWATGLAILVCTTLIALLCWLAPNWVLGVVDPTFERHIRLLLPPGLFVFGVYTLLLYTSTRAQAFNVLARARISQGLGGPLSQIVLGLSGLGATGLALGFMVGQTAGTTLLFKRMILDRWAIVKQASWRGVRDMLWRHRAYPMISAPATIVDALGGGAILYLTLTRFYPGPVAGYLFLADRVVARPLVMISNSMLMVFISELGRYRDTDPARLRLRFRQITSRQFLLGLAWVVVINVVATYAFPSIFGEKWAAAVPFLLVISASHLCANTIQCVSNTLQTLNKQVLAASWQVARVVAVFTGFLSCHRAGAGPLVAIEVYSAIQVVACIVMYFMIRSSVDRLVPLPQAGAAT